MSTARIVMFKGVVDAVAKAAGLITFPILARYAGTDGYGAWSQVNTVVGFIIPFAALGLSGAMVRFFADLRWDTATRSRILQVNLAVTLAAGVLGVIMALIAAPLNDLFLKWAQGESLFRWGALLVLLGALSQLQLDFLRARQRLFYLSLLQLFESLAMIAATVVVLPGGFGLIALIQAAALIKLAMLLFVLTGWFTWDKPAVANPAGEDLLRIGPMIAFGIPLVFAGLGVWMMNLADRLVIGYSLSAETLGLYSAASTFAGIIVAVNSPLLLPVYPRLMRAVASNRNEDVLAEVRLFHRYMSLILIPAAVYLMLIIPPLLELLGGSSFRVDRLVVIMLVFALFLDQWNGIAHYFLMCKDKVIFIRNAWVLAGLSNAAANIVMVPLLGLPGAALVTLVTFAALELAFFVAANRMTDLASAYRFRVSVKALAAALAAGAATFALLGSIRPTIGSVLLASAIFALACLAALALLKEIGMQELHSIARALFMHRSS